MTVERASKQIRTHETRLVQRMTLAPIVIICEITCYQHDKRPTASIPRDNFIFDELHGPPPPPPRSYVRFNASRKAGNRGEEERKGAGEKEMVTGGRGARSGTKGEREGESHIRGGHRASKRQLMCRGHNGGRMVHCQDCARSECPRSVSVSSSPRERNILRLRFACTKVRRVRLGMVGDDTCGNPGVYWRCYLTIRRPLPPRDA